MMVDAMEVELFSVLAARKVLILRTAGKVRHVFGPSSATPRNALCHDWPSFQQQKQITNRSTACEYHLKWSPWATSF
jgi:hypothetical protein